MHKRLTAAAAAALAIALGGAAHAATIYDSGDGTQLIGSIDSVKEAAHIVFGSDVTITGVQGFIETFNADPGDVFDISIYSDGPAPGSVLDTVAVSTAVTDATWQGDTNLSWSLAAGGYWVVFDAPDTNTGLLADIWGLAPNTSPIVNYAVKNNFPAWQINHVFDTAIRIFGEGGAPISDTLIQSGPVPEPTTWTLMIGGFGLAGGALRRRRAAA